MSFKGSKTIALVFLAALSSTIALSAGKHGKDHAKAAKECTDKGGTWEKKKKKCDMPKTDDVQSAPTSAPAHAEPTPSEAPAPTNP